MLSFNLKKLLILVIVSQLTPNLYASQSADDGTRKKMQLVRSSRLVTFKDDVEDVLHKTKIKKTASLNTCKSLPAMSGVSNKKIARYNSEGEFKEVIKKFTALVQQEFYLEREDLPSELEERARVFTQNANEVEKILIKYPKLKDFAFKDYIFKDYRPLIFAIINNNRPLFDVLERHDVAMPLEIEGSLPPAHLAAHYANSYAFKKIVEKNPKAMLLVEQSGQTTVLHQLLLGSHEIHDISLQDPQAEKKAIFQEIFKHPKFDRLLKVQDPVGRTPFHLIAACCSAQVIEICLPHVKLANFANRDMYGNTALEYVLRFGDKEKIEIFLNYTENLPRTRNLEVNKFIENAAIVKNFITNINNSSFSDILEAIEYLPEDILVKMSKLYDFDINKVDKHGDTLLHELATPETYDFNKIKKLITLGINKNIKNNQGYFAIDLFLKSFRDVKKHFSVDDANLLISLIPDVSDYDHRPLLKYTKEFCSLEVRQFIENAIKQKQIHHSAKHA